MCLTVSMVYTRSYIFKCVHLREKHKKRRIKKWVFIQYLSKHTDIKSRYSDKSYQNTF